MEPSRVQVLDRALDLIEQLATTESGMSIAELAQRTGLPKSTIHRILLTFSERNYIEKDPSTSFYSLGQKFVEIASIYLNNISLKTEAQPLMHEVAAAFGAVAYLAVREGDEVMYLERVAQFSNLRIYTQIGKREPLYCTALGKVLLASLPIPEFEQLARRLRYTVFTPTTITSPEQLAAEVEQVRHQGYATDRYEHDPGHSCLAVPIYDYTGNVMAAMSVSGPGLLENHELEPAVARMKAAAEAISRRMGYRAV